jgi:hypothetical protein
LIRASLCSDRRSSNIHPAESKLVLKEPGRHPMSVHDSLKDRCNGME